MHNTLH